MTTEQILKDFLEDNNISCSTCKHYTGNTLIPDRCLDVCGNEENRQTNLYIGQRLRLDKKSMCNKWEKY